MENPNPNPAPGKKPSRQSHVPQKEIDRSNLCVTAATYWGTKPTITLEYITQPEFLALATSHQKSIKDRLDAGKTRPQMTTRLSVLDKEFNSATGFVKNYISETYEKANAQSYYAEFGIAKKGNAWALPADRDKRVLALDQMLKALTTHGFENNKYGKTWWTARITEYIALVKTAGTTDSTTSDLVGAKNAQKDMVKKVLTSLIFVIKANYPDTWKTVLRAWGFQKEKF